MVEGACFLPPPHTINRIFTINTSTWVENSKSKCLQWIHIDRHMDSHFPHNQYFAVEIQEGIDTLSKH